MSLYQKLEEFNQIHFDELNFSIASFARIDYSKKSYEIKTFYLPVLQEIDSRLYFDLASLTKPLTLGLANLKYDLKKELRLLSSHRAGLPAFGTLSRDTWKKHINSFSIKESETLYSDFSALRFMLEYDNSHDQKLENLCNEFYENKIKYWLSLTSCERENSVITGVRGKELIQGEVHDPNGFNLSCFCSHAGFFAYHEGLCDSLLKLNNKLNMLNEVPNRMDAANRFVDGFDRVQDVDNTLAGKGATLKTFGHLGFTGTCFWIDPDKKLGWSLLTNATEYYWYDRRYLNSLRRFFGELIWSGYCVD